MGYIRFKLLLRRTDSEGLAQKCIITRMESDMPGAATLDTNIIMHALSLAGKVEQQTKGFPYTFPIALGE